MNNNEDKNSALPEYSAPFGSDAAEVGRGGSGNGAGVESNDDIEAVDYSSPWGGNNSPIKTQGRHKGAKDITPRKVRKDKGKKRGPRLPGRSIAQSNTQYERARELEEWDERIAAEAFPDEADQMSLKHRQMFKTFLRTLRPGPNAANNEGVRVVAVYLKGAQLKAFYLSRLTLMQTKQLRPDDSMSRAMATIIEDHCRIARSWDKRVGIGEQLDYTDLPIGSISTTNTKDSEPG